MAGFNNAESLEEFKHRLNSLTGKLNKVHKDSDQAPNTIEGVAYVGKNPVARA
jgi:hypothetical protein